MTPLLFLFTLCVSFAGADNCDYSWYVVDNLDYAGSYDPTTKTVLVSPDRITEVITHEVKHIQCELSYKDDTNLNITYCNYGIDLEYTKQSTHQIDKPPAPENTISGKMLDTLGLIGVVKDFSGQLKEDFN